MTAFVGEALAREGTYLSYLLYEFIVTSSLFSLLPRPKSAD